MGLLVSTAGIDPLRAAGEIARRRALAQAAVYPLGLPSSHPDIVAPGWEGAAPPTGAASLTRLSCLDPGGRTGGSPAVVDIGVPAATPVGICLFGLSGHSSQPWWEWYCPPDGSSLHLRMLARGWHIAAVDMPNYGAQGTQAVMVNGALRTMTYQHFHVPHDVTPPFDGPELLRLYLDHIIRAINWVLDNVANEVCLWGESGGGATAYLLAAIENRFSRVYWLQGAHPIAPGASVGDLEQWNKNAILSAATNGCWGDLAILGAGVNGRRAVVCSADADEYTQDQHRTWESLVSNYASILERDFAASFAFYRKTTGSHSIDPTEAAWIEADLLN